MINKLFNRILIANRGEIACRIIKTCQRLGIETLAICSEADQASLHAKIADQTLVLRGNEAKDTYLNKDSILKLAKEYRVDAVHPGYGFLSGNCDFASACNDSGITFIGPSIDTISCFGHKEQARKLAEQNSVPVLPGSTNLNSVEQAKAYANQIGYPILIKCSSGGGGIGMLLCHNEENLETMFNKAKTTGRHYFSNPDVFIEKYITNTRHIEVQIFGDSQGHITVLGERECSIQRRYQKIIEETPSPFVNNELRSKLFACARQLAKAVEYRSAGTVEFIVDVNTGKFYFLEVNTRLQVEHTITEEVGNIDLVEWMLRQAADDNFSVANFSWKPKGHAIQVRVYAEDPSQNFQPATGRLSNVTQANNTWDRYDTGVEAGFTISPYYDPLLAKIIVKGKDRSQALERLTTSLNNTRFDGIVTNLDYLKQLAVTSEFVSGNYTTLLTESFDYQTCDLEVMDGGLYTTIQDYPGRMGMWDVGVPPSGPMDDQACRVANLLVGNSEGHSTLEITLQGPILKFRTATVFALTGADMDACLNDEPVALYQTHYARKGSILKVKTAVHGGYRCYLAVRGGFDLPTYLGSQATFPMAQLGGLNGTPLAMGEYLPLCRNVL
jgi:urea carboxylase